jgi:hypothetical protein
MYEFRRESPRIDVQALCWELVDRHEVSGLAVDLSTMGLKIERPYVGGHTRREVPLQIEVPGIDEIMWARGDAVFDTVIPGGPTGLIRRTGYHLVLAASRDMRLLKEFVYETHRTRTIDDDMLELGYWSAPEYSARYASTMRS